MAKHLRQQIEEINQQIHRYKYEIDQINNKRDSLKAQLNKLWIQWQNAQMELMIAAHGQPILEVGQNIIVSHICDAMRKYKSAAKVGDIGIIEGPISWQLESIVMIRGKTEDWRIVHIPYSDVQKMRQAWLDREGRNNGN